MTNRMLSRTPDHAFIDTHTTNPFSDIAVNHWGYYEVIEASVAHQFKIDNDSEGAWQSIL